MVLRHMQLDRTFEALESFDEVSAHVPKVMERAGKSRMPLRVDISSPIERGAQIVMLGLEPVQPFQHIRLTKLRLRMLPQCNEVVEMTAPRRIRRLLCLTSFSAAYWRIVSRK